MTDTAEIEFKPNDRTREILRSFGNDMAEQAMKEFFDLWETEGDPRRAGSIMAHRFIRLGARFAVFGTACSGREPDIDLWMAVCRERAEEAIREVAHAFAEAESANNTKD